MHVIQQLYQKEYDFPKVDRYSISYMIATIPRSGSTYLSIEMWRSGQLGSPMEYLNQLAAEPLLARLGFLQSNVSKISRESLLDYWQTVKMLRTSPNGVFGYKMFMEIFREVIASYPDIFDDILPDYIIYLTREDVLGQAISYAKARKTNAWFADAPVEGPSIYNFDHISQCIRNIEVQKYYWEEVFAQANIDPIRVSYEELRENPMSTVDSIIEQLGLTPDHSMRLSIPTIRQQSDSTSTMWRKRYELEKSKLATPL